MSKEAQRVSRLILTGFMGAGKSTVGRLLAQELGWRFVDLDQEIEAASQRTVAEIFREFGEALGGGTIEDESTRTRLIQSQGNCLIFLEAPLAELLARCTVGGKSRPLLSSSEPPEARHQRRLPHYRAAHLTVNTIGLGPREVAGRVLERVSLEWLIELKKR
jgi:shikimate kinase